MLLFATFIGGSYWISKPLVEGERGAFAPEIAEFSEALTFARSAKALVLVTGHSGDGVTGIDLTAIYGEALTSDLSIFLQRVTPQEAASSVSGASHYPLGQLISPVAFSKPSVAAGTNFREHADEVYSDDPPFLFPKLTQPGFWHDAVPYPTNAPAKCGRPERAWANAVYGASHEMALLPFHLRASLRRRRARPRAATR